MKRRLLFFFFFLFAQKMCALSSNFSSDFPPGEVATGKHSQKPSKWSRTTFAPRILLLPTWNHTLANDFYAHLISSYHLSSGRVKQNKMRNTSCKVFLNGKDGTKVYAFSLLGHSFLRPPWLGVSKWLVGRGFRGDIVQ